MSKKNQDVKRQLFKSMTGSSASKPTPLSPLDEAASTLLSKTLKKQSDTYRTPGEETRHRQHNQRHQKEFVIHKSTSPEQYKIFSSVHPLRDSKLEALETCERALENLFHPDRQNFNFLPSSSFNGNYSVYDYSSDEEDSELPDISNLFQQSELYEDEDDIIISIPGHSKQEIVAMKKLHPKDRKNLRFPKNNSLETTFSLPSSLRYLHGLNRDELHEYNMLHQEYQEELYELRSLKLRSMETQRKFLDEVVKSRYGDDDDDDDDDDENEKGHLELHQVQALREAMASLDSTSWMYDKRGLQFQ